MIKRLVVGLMLGAFLGALVAAALLKGLGAVSFESSVLGATGAYLTAALTGALTGLVAGKPIWSADGKIEAGLKALFGALLASAGMFALRRWVTWGVDLSMIAEGAGRAPVGSLPVISLPLLAAALGAFFELDNTGSGAPSEGDARKGSKPKSEEKLRVSQEPAGAEGDLDEEAQAAKRRR